MIAEYSIHGFDIVFKGDMGKKGMFISPDLGRRDPHLEAKSLLKNQ
jgi:hypothetical protein